MTRSASREADGSPQMVRIATVGAAHGLSGQVRLQLHTDNPDERLARGSRLSTDPSEPGPLTVSMLRSAQDQWYAKFEGVTDRTAAEALRGVVLLAEEDTAEPGAWYPRQLRGLRAEDRAGNSLGVVADVRHLPAQDALVLREESGATTLIPFVAPIVPVVDVAAGRVVIDPPPGLLAGDQRDSQEEA